MHVVLVMHVKYMREMNSVRYMELEIAFWIGFCVIELKAWHHTPGEITLLTFVSG